MERANIRIRDNDGRTLLMNAVRTVNVRAVKILLARMKHECPELINARNKNGWHVFHYLQLYKQSEEYFRNRSVDCIENREHNILCDLIKAGADINAMVNGNPDTQILNFLATKNRLDMVQELLEFKRSMEPSFRPLHYAILPVGSDQLAHMFNNPEMTGPESGRRSTIEYILKNLVIRRTFRLFVPEEEIQLMDNLAATDDNIGKIVKDYQNDVVNSLKDDVITYADKSITVFDLVVKSCNNTLKQVIANDIFEAYCEFLFGDKKCKDRAMFQLLHVTKSRLKEADERKKLMEKVKEIENLRKAIPLPYEIILTIIEFLENSDLKIFIDAFYQ